MNGLPQTKDLQGTIMITAAEVAQLKATGEWADLTRWKLKNLEDLLKREAMK